jgi:alkaline phosphatase D
MHKLTFITLLLCLTACAAEPPVSRIAFGSCMNQARPAPMWDTIVAARPELFLFIGDNIYADTTDMAVMREKYGTLGAMPGYQALLKTCPLMATWDDHDLGENDAGADYPKKAESQQEFLTFFHEPKDSPRWTRPGVYDAKIIGPPGRRVQVILLDTRYFRSPLTAIPKSERKPGQGYYLPDDRQELTMLGDEQWQWLAEQLRKPAELRIVASSVQFVPEEHHWEYWANFPRERTRLARLIGETKASGVIIISGDRHLAEISRLPATDPANGAGYPLLDVTSSSLNVPSGGNADEPNRHRLGFNYRKVNFGTIEIDWSAPDPLITLQVRDIDGKPALEHQIKLSELRPGTP